MDLCVLWFNSFIPFYESSPHLILQLLAPFHLPHRDQEGGASSLVTANNTLNNNNNNNNNNNAQATLEKQLERDRADSTLSLLGNNHTNLGTYVCICVIIIIACVC